MFDCVLSFYFVLTTLGYHHIHHLLSHLHVVVVVVNRLSIAALLYHYQIYYVSMPLIWLGQPFALYF